MIRMFDYECARHGTFEVMITTETVPDYMECMCGEISRRVWRRAPSMNNGDVHAIEFGGRTFRRDDVESLLDQKEDKSSPFDTPAFKEKLMESFSRNAYKEMHGTLAPQNADVPKDAGSQTALENVNVSSEQVQAQTSALVETMRRTDFKE